jgi:hypothetical protein
LQKLKLDFYESGKGETIVITFPSGGIGLVDAHPSNHSFRPEILKIIEGKKLHFVCLTHPHADHGVDLVPVLQNHEQIEAFWHTIYHIPAFIYGVSQTVSFPSAVREFATKMNQDWGKFLINIFGAVAERDIPTHELRSNLQAEVIDGVEIHCLSPDESVQNSFSSAYHKKLINPILAVPDPNLISAVLVLRLGESVVLLGADARKENWETAVKHYQKRKLPKAKILKVPHHGARNSLNLQHQGQSYFDVCSHSPKASAVIFAADSKHPDKKVFEKLQSRMDTICLSNGLKSKAANPNPLRLQLPGATAVYPAPVCNPVLSFELDSEGNVSLLAGVSCETGCFTSSAS